MEQKEPHAEQRLRERTQLPASTLTRLRKKMDGKRFPSGAQHVVLRDGSYAVLKDIGGRHVLATVLSRNMQPPGNDMRARLEKVAMLLGLTR